MRSVIARHNGSRSLIELHPAGNVRLVIFLVLHSRAIKVPITDTVVNTVYQRCAKNFKLKAEGNKNYKSTTKFIKCNLKITIL